MLNKLKKVYYKIKDYYKPDVIRNVNKTSYAKNCLVVYIVEPFLGPISDRHQNQWQAAMIAKIFGENGYNVDIVNYQHRKKPRLSKKYDLVFGLIPREDHFYEKFLHENAIRIAYLTSSNLVFTREAEQKRLDELEKRRGVRLKAYRQTATIDKSIERFNAAFFFGNEYNIQTYSCFRMPPVYYIVNNGYDNLYIPPFSEHHADSFLFFGSLGQVHKGLDLLLEMFSIPGFPFHLYVCGAYEQETDFCEEYQQELYQCENIHPMGFVDIHSETYQKVVSQCAYMLLPSCAEGCAGSVVTVMSSGVIPIVSKECGYDDDAVINLPDCHSDTIWQFVFDYGNKDPEWVAEQSEKMVSIVRNKFSKNDFIRSFSEAVKQTCSGGKK